MTGVGPGGIPDVFAELDDRDEQYGGELVADGGVPADDCDVGLGTIRDVSHTREDAPDCTI